VLNNIEFVTKGPIFWQVGALIKARGGVRLFWGSIFRNRFILAFQQTLNPVIIQINMCEVMIGG